MGYHRCSCFFKRNINRIWQGSAAAAQLTDIRFCIQELYFFYCIPERNNSKKPWHCYANRNLLEYGYNHAKTSGRLYQYARMQEIKLQINYYCNSNYNVTKQLKIVVQNFNDFWRRLLTLPLGFFIGFVRYSCNCKYYSKLKTFDNYATKTKIKI